MEKGNEYIRQAMEGILNRLVQRLESFDEERLMARVQSDLVDDCLNSSMN